MIKAFSTLALLSALMAVSSAGDWLEGGYVGKGSYGDVRQYFTDPIFYSSGSHVTSSDPAIRQMEASMDRYSSRYASLGSSNTKSTIGKSASDRSAYAGIAGNQAVNAAGGWRLELSDGTLVDLDLSQSGARVFGPGSMKSASSSAWAVASGEVVGTVLSLDIVPAGGKELYAVSIDISRLHLPGSYTAFRAGAGQLTGNVMASRIVSSSA